MTKSRKVLRTTTAALAVTCAVVHGYHAVNTHPGYFVSFAIWLYVSGFCIREAYRGWSGADI